MSKVKQMQFEEVSRIIDRVVESSLEDLMHGAMMPYSEYVILDRALPRVEDGLKPVQRRILYTMHELGLTPDKPYKKSARIVGDCLGKYHPHGDSSVYGAMVRMAQDFNMSMCLVDGHGNYGSVDGDSAAAMRYTEARLSPIAVEMLRDIDKDTVKWSLNFDDSLKEPDMLPSRFPNILVNGASGIAIGLATNIPPHNLEEVIDGAIELINNPRMNLETLMNTIKAPDFPTGGYIIAGEGLKEAYETGNGKIKLRAKVAIEKNGDKHQIVITEIPYQVNKANLLQSIMELKESNHKDFNMISDVVDESDRRGMRAVIKLKKDADANKILKALFIKTKLEVSYSINMVAIADGRPQQLGLVPMLKYYIEYQRNLILKRSQFDLAAAKKREEILSGLHKAILNIDEVIAIIKGASSISDAKTTLKDTFGFSEIQAVAILEMKLGRLTNLEITRLIEELKAVRILIEELSEIVASKSKQYEVLKRELKDIKKRFKIERKSNIISEEFDIEIPVDQANGDTAKAREGIVILNRNGLIKLVSERSYQLADKQISKLDDISIPVQSIRLGEGAALIAITNKGNAVRLDLDAVPEKGFKAKGAELKAVCPSALSGEKIVKILSVGDTGDKYLYLMTRDGVIKKSALNEYDVARDYYQAIILKDGDEVINAEEVIGTQSILYVTEQGMCLNSVIDSIPVQGRKASGVKGINLNDGDRVLFASQVDCEGEIIAITDTGYAKRIICATIELSQRYRKGISIYKLTGRQGQKLIFSGYVKMPYDLALLINDTDILKLNTEDISLESRTSVGRELIKDKDKRITDVIIKAENI
jgi:DNA gyrase subunit A